MEEGVLEPELSWFHKLKTFTTFTNLSATFTNFLIPLEITIFRITHFQFLSFKIASPCLMLSIIKTIQFLSNCIGT